MNLVDLFFDSLDSMWRTDPLLVFLCIFLLMFATAAITNVVLNWWQRGHRHQRVTGGKMAANRMLRR